MALAQFRYFLDLPPEIRNHIYDIALVKDHPISITSIRNRRKNEPPSTDFGRLLRVNKQINSEAKTVFYSLNTFAVGNGWWGSRKEENLQALKAFCKRVPKDCIARIKHVQFVIWYYGYWSGSHHPPIVEVERGCTSDLTNLGRAVLKYFTGVETLSFCAVVSNQSGLLAKDQLSADRPARFRHASPVMALAKELRKIVDGFAGKGLKEIIWIQGGLRLGSLAEMVNHAGLTEKVTTKIVEWKDVPSP